MRINFERTLFDEIVRMYPTIRQPPTLMLNIVKKIGLSKIDPSWKASYKNKNLLENKIQNKMHSLAS